MRNQHVLLVLLAAAGATGGLVAPAAGAAGPPAPAVAAGVIVGDLTGDGIADRTTLTSSGSGSSLRCGASVRPGLAGGSFGPAQAHSLAIHGSTVSTCPDLGVVLAGRTPVFDKLAVAFTSVAPIGGPGVQVFRDFRYVTGFAGESQPSVIGTRDFDGDGLGDVYEITDQGDGLFVSAGPTFATLYSSSPSSDDRHSFVNFDHGPGLDILDTHSFFGFQNVGVTVVDGHSGKKIDLVADTSSDPDVYTASAVYADGDGYLDVKVKRTASDGTVLPALIFRNAGNGTFAFTQS